MKVRIKSTGGFGVQDIVGKVVEATEDLYIPHSELCRVSAVWAKELAEEDEKYGTVTEPDFLWCFTRDELEILE